MTDIAAVDAPEIRAGSARWGEAHPARPDEGGREGPPLTTEPFDFSGATHGKVGMWVFLLTDAMSFFGLLLGYGVLRAGSPDWPDPARHLGIGLTAVMTFVLICSSVTMVLALAAAAERRRDALCRWLGLTVLGGLAFLGGQAYEYTHLAHAEHMTLSGAAFTGGDIHFPQTFFLITGFHGLHVLVGVLYLGVILARALRGRYTEGPQASAGSVEVAGLFWHFVDLVWILVFTFVYLV